MSAWVWVIIGLSIFSALVILVLCIPFRIELVLDSTAKHKLRLSFNGLFGMIRYDITRGDQKAKSGMRGEKRRISSRVMWRILNIRGFFTNVKNLGRRVLRQIRFTGIAANLTIGFDDPAECGTFFAVAGIFRPFLKLPKEYQFAIQPIMSDHSFIDGYLSSAIHLQPVKLIFPVCRFIFSLPTLKMVGILVSNSRHN